MMNNQKSKDGLTERQDAFARHVARGLTQTEAARRAGYSAKAATQAACRLMKEEHIQARIAKYSGTEAPDTELNIEEFKTSLAEVFRNDPRTRHLTGKLIKDLQFNQHEAERKRDHLFNIHISVVLPPETGLNTKESGVT